MGSLKSEDRIVGWEIVLDWGMVGLGGCGLLVLQPG